MSITRLLAIPLFAFLFAFLPAGAGLAQSGWEIQNSGTTQNLYAASFVDRNEGWVVGGATTHDVSVILHTTDGGKTWAPQDAGVAKRLFNVKFLDHLTGWITGEDNVILHTTDGGQHWTLQPANGSPFYAPVRGLFMLDATHGWASADDGGVYYTTDGQVWDWVNSSACPACEQQNLISVWFIDALHGWTAGWNDYLLSTDNGGKSWTRRTSPDQKTIYNIQFVSLSEGFMVGSVGRIFHTADAGASWQAQDTGYPPVTPSPILYGLDMVSPTIGFVVGQYGVILATSDGGQHWVQQASPSTNLLEGVCFVSPTEGWAVGYNGTILHTSTGGVPPGDVDGNGVVNLDDVRLALRLSAGLLPADQAQVASGNLAGSDQALTIADAVALLRRLAS